MQGPQGIQGPQGATGQAEAWSSGAGAPSGATGAVGDWYLNTTNGAVYEKTGASTWTQRANITGPQGATGTQGSTGSQGPAGTAGEKWFTGSGAPAGATGIVGDWYLDSSSGDYHEKTGASAWTLRGNLKGPQGATGAQGPQGPPGTASVPARLGETPAAPPGDNLDTLGVSGWYWYQPSTVGRPADGYGYVQVYAWPGVLATTQVAYEHGSNRSWQRTGAGAWQPIGATFVSGNGAPPAALGVDGAIYLDVASFRLYGPKAAGAWPGTAFARAIPLNPTYRQIKGG